jgi:hypothetical protein
MGGKFTNSFQRSPKPSKTGQKLLATLLAILLRGPTSKTLGVRKPAEPMTLHTVAGARKYLNVAERKRFAAAAKTLPPEARVFCLLLMWSGCRISEGLKVTPSAIDLEAGTVAFVTLKRRKTSVVRQVPVPAALIEELTKVFNLRERERDADLCGVRLWRWSRSTAWRWVKVVMKRAALSGSAAMPRGLRHTFGVAAFQAVPPHIVQRWLGHASLRTTGIYGGRKRTRRASFCRKNLGELVTNNLALAVAAYYGGQVARPVFLLPHRAITGPRRAQADNAAATTLYSPVIYVIYEGHGGVASLVEPGSSYAEPSTSASYGCTTKLCCIIRIKANCDSGTEVGYHKFLSTTAAMVSGDI